MQEQILKEIIDDLAENFRAFGEEGESFEKEKEILNNLLGRVIADALIISNRLNTSTNISFLRSEIIDTVKALYLQRGSEDVNSKSESGLNSNYKKAVKEMRENIVTNGKRIVI